jgi:hypothetical protein
MQQTPSMQKPLPHWSPDPQLVPNPCLGVQVPFEVAVQ